MQPFVSSRTLYCHNQQVQNCNVHKCSKSTQFVGRVVLQNTHARNVFRESLGRLVVCSFGFCHVHVNMCANGLHPLDSRTVRSVLKPQQLTNQRSRRESARSPFSFCPKIARTLADKSNTSTCTFPFLCRCGRHTKRKP